MVDLPRNAEYIIHKNECYDWGSVGWALQTEKVDTRIYKYFIFLNSSVRGPFLPSYHNVRSSISSLVDAPAITNIVVLEPHLYSIYITTIHELECCAVLIDCGSKRYHAHMYHWHFSSVVLQADVHWTSLYTQRLNKDVKLVGSTINCQPIHFHSNPANEMRQNPHVQSYLVATDQVRVSLLPNKVSSSPNWWHHNKTSWNTQRSFCFDETCLRMFQHPCVWQLIDSQVSQKTITPPDCKFLCSGGPAGAEEWRQCL